MARVEIRQLEELEVFDALRLSVEVLAEILAEILAELAGGTELEVLLVAVRYWDSLKSYTSFGAQSLVVVGGYL